MTDTPTHQKKHCHQRLFQLIKPHTEDVCRAGNSRSLHYIHVESEAESSYEMIISELRLKDPIRIKAQYNKTYMLKCVP